MDPKTSIVELAQMNEDQARQLLEAIIWPDGVTCPHCGTVGEAGKLNGKAHRKGLYKCYACRKQFSVTVNTVMHRSRVPLVKWLLAIHLMCSSKKGISALQLKRQLNLGSYQTAWHLCHRIRYAMEHGDFGAKLGADGGTVEVDETYVGGKPRRGGKTKATAPGRGTSKTPVVALVDREKGIARAVPMTSVDSLGLGKLMRENVDRSATIMTDDNRSYLGPPGTGKSHLAQAIGRAVILQGHRVFYREAHALLEELAEATLDGTRKERMEELGAISLLIIDDLGMRKLPHTAAEDLLELIMRRYERASTLITSNRPVEDWGKLLGDTAAVSAMLDRMLHHGHVLKCGPRSWRTRNAGLKREDGTK